MSFTLKTWSGFSKRINSTKQPTSGSDLTVKLKDGTSITEPTFLCSTVGTGVNYVYSSDWGRYYFVRDAVQVTADQVELRCSVDHLASAKTYIGNTKANIERTSSSVNLLVTDPRNAPTFKYLTKYTSLKDLSSNGFSTSGSYICGFVTDNGLRYYVLDASKLADVCAGIFSSNFVQALENQLYDMKNIFVSCIWLPFNPSGISLSSTITVRGESLKDGGGNVITAPYIPLSSRYVSIAASSVTVGYPYDGTYNVDNYLDAAPYTTGTMYLPFVGVVPFDVDIFFNDKTAQLSLVLDTYTGDIVYRLQDSANNLVATYQGNCASQVPIAGQTNNPLATVAGGLSLIGGAASLLAGNVGVGIGGAAGGALAVASGMQLHTQVNGTISSGIGSQLSLDAHVVVRTRKPCETAIESAWQNDGGWEQHQDQTISSLSGYVKCTDASVDCPFTESEKQAINGFLNSGFYYE